MGILACKSVLTTEKGWLFASSRMFVKGDSNIKASGGVSEKCRALSISAKLLVHPYKNMFCIYLEGHISSVEECKSKVGTTHRHIIARRLSGVQKYAIIFDLYLDETVCILTSFLKPLRQTTKWINSGLEFRRSVKSWTLIAFKNL